MLLKIHIHFVFVVAPPFDRLLDKELEDLQKYETTEAHKGQPPREKEHHGYRKENDKFCLLALGNVLSEVFFELFNVFLNLFCVVLIDTFLLIELFTLLLMLGTLSEVVVVKVIS